MGEDYRLMTESYKDYTHYSAELTKKISEYFLEEKLGVTVSIVDDIYVELLFKPNRLDFEVAVQQTDTFYQMIEEMPELFGLKSFRVESTMYQKLELDEEYNRFYYEKVLLKGVKNG